MSTGLECQFVEVQPGRWYYLLENYSAPKMAWDWREYATAYGPFSTFEEGDRHLSANHANPGGFGVVRYFEGFKPDAVLARLIKEAGDRRPVHYRYSGGRW